MGIQFSANLAELPNDLKIYIANMLPPKSLLACSRVCKSWRIALENYPRSQALFGSKRIAFRAKWQAQEDSRAKGIVLGLLATLAGVATLPRGVLLPAILFGSGTASLTYALKSPIDQYSTRENFRNMGYGAFSATLTGFLSYAEPFGRTFVARISNQIFSQLTGTLTQKLLKGEEIEPAALAIAATTTLVSSSVSYGLDSALEKATDHVADVAIREFILGAGSSGAGKVAENLLKKEKWDKNLEEAAFAGGVFGAIQGVGRYQGEKEYQRQQKKELEFKQMIANRLPEQFEQQQQIYFDMLKSHLEKVDQQFGKQIAGLIQEGYQSTHPQLPSTSEAITQMLAQGQRVELISPQGQRVELYGETLEQDWQAIAAQQHALQQTQAAYNAVMEKLNAKRGWIIDNYLKSRSYQIGEATQFNRDRDAMLRHLANGGELHLYDPPNFEIRLTTAEPTATKDYRYWIEHYLENGYGIMHPCNGNVDEMLALLHRTGELVFWVPHIMTAFSITPRP